MGSDAATRLGILGLGVAESFGKENIAVELASSLKELFPKATFLRVSLRSGTGLFVTDNLLYPGYCMIHLVSLKSSLSAVCMKEGDMVQMKLPEELSSGATRLILATPVVVQAPEGEAFKPLIVGSIIAGFGEKELETQAVSNLEAMSQHLGTPLLTVGMGYVSRLSHLLKLRDQDSQFIGAEESLQDLPWDIPRPPGANEPYDGGPEDDNYESMDRYESSENEFCMAQGSGGQEPSSTGSRSSSLSSSNFVGDDGWLPAVDSESSLLEQACRAFMDEGLMADATALPSTAAADIKGSGMCFEEPEVLKRISDDDFIPEPCPIDNQEIYGTRINSKGKVLSPLVVQKSVGAHGKTVAFCSVYLLSILAYSFFAPKEQHPAVLLPLLASLVGAVSGIFGCLGKQSSLVSKRDAILFAFVLVHFVAQFWSDGVPLSQDWRELKYMMIRSVVFLEGSLAVCGVSPFWSFSAHLGIGLAYLLAKSQL
eukprot:jgi/Picsp_1/6570/NSC_03913-R1_hypothetical protein CHLNCDRAFT_144567 [Chlorella variabilis]